MEPPFSHFQAWAAVFLSWLTAQLAKVARSALQEKRLSLRWLFGAGGMPSSHSATVSSLSTVTGLYFGFSSLPFLIVLIFTLITMFDAAGVRRNVGRQARILNKMLDEFYEKGEFKEGRLKELLGHTPVEVFAGAFLGIIIALLICAF
ncbi:MAG: divergent PAP2 family protein [Candidatus Omnitrophica bacterium]|nr:divergent PAP2 family protein [Candidatus Omnitrophota bacterium]